MLRYLDLPIPARQHLASLTRAEAMALYPISRGTAWQWVKWARADHPACVVCGNHHTRVVSGAGGGEIEYCDDCEIGMRRIRRRVASEEERMWAQM